MKKPLNLAKDQIGLAEFFESSNHPAYVTKTLLRQGSRLGAENGSSFGLNFFGWAMSNLSNASQNHAHTSRGLCVRCGLLSQCSRSLANRMPFFFRTIWEQLARCWKPFRLVQGLIRVGMFFRNQCAGTFHVRVWDTRVVPQKTSFSGSRSDNGSIRRFSKNGGSRRRAIVDLLAPRGSWNFTKLGNQLLPDGWRQAGWWDNGYWIQPSTLNATLGYAFDLGFVDVHPQYMVGLGEETLDM